MIVEIIVYLRPNPTQSVGRVNAFAFNRIPSRPFSARMPYLRSFTAVQNPNHEQSDGIH